MRPWGGGGPRVRAAALLPGLCGLREVLQFVDLPKEVRQGCCMYVEVERQGLVMCRVLDSAWYQGPSLQARSLSGVLWPFHSSSLDQEALLPTRS